jgi:hypothetical protein
VLVKEGEERELLQALLDLPAAALTPEAARLRQKLRLRHVCDAMVPCRNDPSLIGMVLVLSLKHGS